MKFTREIQALRQAAIAQIPVRHKSGDAAWVEVTALLEYRPETHDMTPEELARIATEELDEATEAWQAEREYQRSIR